MQIPPIPPPVTANPLSHDVTTKAVPNIQAMAPLVQNAVAPTPKSEKFNQTRDNKDKSRGERGDEREQRKDKQEKDEHAVNIRV